MMDSVEPDFTYSAITSHTSRLARLYRVYMDKCTPYVAYRWLASLVLFLTFVARILLTQSWYIVAYTLGIYLLNLFLAFISPKFDPSLNEFGYDDDDINTTRRSPFNFTTSRSSSSSAPGASSLLPTKEDQEFRPFVRCLPEFKFWLSATRAILIGLFASCFNAFDLPVFWPILVMYWFLLFVLTMRRQIKHMIKYRYVPFNIGKTRYNPVASYQSYTSPSSPPPPPFTATATASSLSNPTSISSSVHAPFCAPPVQPIQPHPPPPPSASTVHPPLQNAPTSTAAISPPSVTAASPPLANSNVQSTAPLSQPSIPVNPSFPYQPSPSPSRKYS